MDSSFWVDLLEKVLVLVIPPIAASLVAMAVALFKKWWAEFQAAKPDIADIVEKLAAFAVEAAEELGASQLITDKKEYAIAMVEKWLAEKGLAIDVDLIESAVEAAVFEIMHEGQEIKAASRKEVKKPVVVESSYARPAKNA